METNDTKKMEAPEPAKQGDEGLLVDIKEFARIEIRVAQVLQAERVMGSDRLLELRVNSGADERTILAGIAQFYEPEYLINKKILLVANLKPAKIFNKISNGMLLAAKGEGGRPHLIEVNESVPVGSRLS